MTVFGVRWRLYRDAEPRRGWREALILFAIFAVALYSGVEWARSTDNGSVFWTANGVLAAGLLLLPRRLGWLFAAACIGLNATLNVFSGLPPVFNFAFTSLNLFVAFGAAALVRTFCGAALDLGRLRRFLPFVGLMAGLCLVEGFTGATITRAFGALDFVTITLRWAACDATGLILGLPATLMAMRRVNPLYAGPAGRMERWAILALIGAGSLAAFSTTAFPGFLLIFPVLAFAAFRLGAAWSFPGVWLAAQAATYQSLHDRGPLTLFEGEPPFTGLGLLQLTVAAFILTSAFATSALGERLRSEHRLRRKEASAAASRARVEQMAHTRERFLAVVSHEIRTPLNGVLGFAGALARREDLHPEARRQIERIGRSTDELMLVVDDILDFSRIETDRLELEPISARVPDAIRTAVSRAASSARIKGLSFEVVAPADAGFSRVDARRLGQAVAKLADNAVKFTEQGGVEIRIERADQGEADAWTIRVLDTGPGVPAARRGELFQPFSQLDASISRQHAGTGLGLAITRSLVERMDGAVDYAPRAEGGSEFRVTVALPRAGAPLPEAAPALPEAAEAEDRAPRVLIVDDHPVNREVARLILSAVGCEIMEAEGGAEAVEAARTTAFDVILMDVRMPGMDGIQATRAIRALPCPTASAVPILAVTADVMREDIDRCRASGMNGHVPKPLDQSRLIAAVQTALCGGGAFPVAVAA